MNRDDAIRKIQSCLNMARSGQASEAATALRQAQAMMTRYGIDHPEILAAAANAIQVTAGAASRPARYESRLAAMVADASGCKVIFTPHWTMGHWTFIGCSPGLDIAAYSMQVLKRQLLKARRTYIETKLKRYKRENKTIRADAYCEAWVQTVSDLLSRYEASPEQTQAIDAYIAQHHPQLGQLRPTCRVSRIDTTRDQLYGIRDGQTAELRSAVGTRAAPLQLGRSP